MRTLILLGAFALVNVVGAVAFFVAGKIALHLDPSAHESHISAFMVAITGVAVAVASAFPIFGRLAPWVAARLELRGLPQTIRAIAATTATATRESATDIQSDMGSHARAGLAAGWKSK